MTHTDQFEEIVNTAVRDICSVSVAPAAKSKVREIVLSALHHIREETEKEMGESLIQEILKNKKEFFDFKKVPKLTTVADYPYEFGYAQAMNNVTSMIYKRLPNEVTPGATTASPSHLERDNPTHI